MSHIGQNPEVIVVGAGAAGLSAAQSLRNAGIETLVLEAAGHAGGRCVTDTSTFSVPFDRGGSWMHSAAINPLARLAEERGVKLYKADWNSATVQAKGYNLTAEELADYGAYGDAMWEGINARGGQLPDVSAAEALPSGRWSDTVSCWVAQMVGGDADVTSARDSYNYADAEGDWLVAGGLGAFVQDLHREVPVALNCPVEKIDYAGAGVRVTTADGVIESKHLILTVSTGVLAAERIAFTPPLPAAKRAAVEGLPNGLLNKIGIEFDPAWREATEGDRADYHVGDAQFCTICFGFLDTPLAVGFVAGRFAAALEQEGAGAATDFCLQGLQAMYGSDVLKHVRQTDETAWHTNALTYGSYSFARPGQTEARPVLAEPVADRLFFAGEATMTDTYSTVHGAYLSGKRAAHEVVTAMGKQAAPAQPLET